MPDRDFRVPACAGMTRKWKHSDYTCTSFELHQKGANGPVFLSDLELFGFKSFPKRTKLTFNPGVMAVVGPNGCGKSNLVDAVRWVLGEQRTSVLRSDKMENVIFAGANGRKPMHMAEVTLIIQNDRGVLPAEYPEVAVTRRLHRTGESEYLINKRTARLKDIRALFADTGLGPDSYAIIELAMVKEILSGNADERRRLFEEAAGVTLYKVRLRAARNKLNATEADLLRLEDLIAEIQTRRNSLQRQVAKARRYRYLREVMRSKELTAASEEFSTLKTRLAPLEERVARDREQKQALETKLSRAEEDQAALRGRVSGLEDRLNKLRSEHSDLQTRSQGIHQDIVMLQERIRSSEQRRKEQDTEEVELIQRRKQIAQEIDTLDKQRQEAAARLKKVRAKLEELNGDWNEFDKQHQALAAKRNEAAELSNDTERKVAALDSETRQLAARLDAARHRLKQLKEEAGADIDLPDLDVLNQRVEEKTETVAELDGERVKARETLDTTREERSKAQREAARAASELQAIRRRVGLLESMVVGGEGRPKAVKALLKAGLKGVLGRLGDAVVVDDQWKAAAAAALEEAASAVAVKDGAGMTEAVNLLLQGDKGRGLLLLTDTARAAKTPPPFAEAEGVEGRLNDRIRFKGKAGAAAEAFLANVWLVRDLDYLLHHATAAQETGMALVTPEGAFLSSHGILAAGKVDPADLGAEELLQTAREEEKQAEDRNAQAQSEVTRLELDEQQAQKQLADLANRLRDDRTELERLRREAHRVESDLNAHRAVEKRRADEIATLELDIQSFRQQHDKKQGELEKLQAEASELNDTLQQVQAELRNHEEAGQALRSAREERRDQQMDTASEVEKLQGEVRRLGALLDEITNRLERIDQERKQGREAAGDAADRLKRLEAEREVVDKELTDTAATLTKTQDEHEKERRTYAEKNGLLEADRAELARTSDRLHTNELSVSDMRHQFNAIRERILETYKIDLSTARQEELPLAISGDNPYVDRALSELRDALHNIGPVNQMAVEEFEEVDRRYKTMNEQREDLVEAKETLDQTIKEINSIARRRFVETFKRVEANFVDLFHRLFRGGEASLALDEGDPLEAGIKIFASPRGKRLTAVDLLSGGEKAMTAIALLFALYLERPAPFCFLDEVDAPLDDVNVERFNDLLREFTESTQFLVVTHNKLTMERADRLYGVTMEEDGVSKLVAVELGKRREDDAGETVAQEKEA